MRGANRIGRLSLAGGLLVLLALAAPAAEEPLLGAPEAARMAAEGRLLIVDVRTPGEWRRTGLSPGAAPVSLHDADGAAGFLRRIAELTGGDRDTRLALICAAGVRSAHAARLLRAEGYRAVSDIGEGMLGSRGGPGWLARGLPVQPCPRC